MTSVRERGKDETIETNFGSISSYYNSRAISGNLYLCDFCEEG